LSHRDGCTEMIHPIPDIEESLGQEGAELSKIPVDMKSGDWFLKIVPWIGGRIISMTHLPSGMLHNHMCNV
jgi:hypothetical protein